MSQARIHPAPLAQDIAAAPNDPDKDLVAANKPADACGRNSPQEIRLKLHVEHEISSSCARSLDFEVPFVDGMPGLPDKRAKELLDFATARSVKVAPFVVKLTGTKLSIYRQDKLVARVQLLLADVVHAQVGDKQVFAISPFQPYPKASSSSWIPRFRRPRTVDRREAWVFYAEPENVQQTLEAIGACGALQFDYDAQFATQAVVLGSGGGGEVKKALAIGREGPEDGYVVKRLKQSRYKLDASAMSELGFLTMAQSHPCIATVTAAFWGEVLVDSEDQEGREKNNKGKPKIEKRWMFVAPSCCNGDIGQLVRAKGPLVEQAAMQMTCCVLSALAHIHQMGIIHRDVKAENILLDEGYQPRLTDFGIATHITDTASRYLRIGTLRYAAPEVLQERSIDYAVDVFGLGVTFYLLVSSFLPFEHDCTGKRAKASARPCLQMISGWTCGIIKQMLLKDHRERPTSLEAFKWIYAGLSHGAAKSNYMDGATAAVTKVVQKIRTNTSTPLPPDILSMLAQRGETLRKARLKEKEEKGERPNKVGMATRIGRFFTSSNATRPVSIVDGVMPTDRALPGMQGSSSFVGEDSKELLGLEDFEEFDFFPSPVPPFRYQCDAGAGFSYADQRNQFDFQNSPGASLPNSSLPGSSSRYQESESRQPVRQNQMAAPGPPGDSPPNSVHSSFFLGDAQLPRIEVDCPADNMRRVPDRAPGEESPDDGSSSPHLSLIMPQNLERYVQEGEFQKEVTLSHVSGTTMQRNPQSSNAASSLAPRGESCSSFSPYNCAGSDHPDLCDPEVQGMSPAAKDEKDDLLNKSANMNSHEKAMDDLLT